MKRRAGATLACDVAEHRRSRKAHKVLKGFVLPTQYSLLEWRLWPQDLLILKERLLQVLEEDEDSLIFFPLCAACQANVQRHGIGRSLLPDDDTIVL